jgi:preprotein translocase subunit YajC
VIFAAEGQQSGGAYITYLLLALFVVALYFVLIRPQQKRRREVESMQAAMGPGDEIVTVGGLYGTIRELDQETVLLEIAPDVTAKFARAAVGKVVTPAARSDDEESSTGTVTESD